MRIVSFRYPKSKAKLMIISLETALTESTRFGECPIILFLALAFADNAFLDASAPEELLELSCNTSSDRREILYKAEKKAEAVFKSEKGGLKNHFSYAAFFNHLKALSERAGYSAHVQPYSIRRAVANRLNGRCSDHDNSSWA